ncbi:hypothetical protein EXIGLDRAFT_722990 [Exidia glandulosa HHB12029]|uniref:F-box domain-containing protein n=1 Tax=Exidia glandulosa HHB12029 TaxID=1314781 RepID=A0A165F119_EXIGL|nr:hypothetical protein EXIGLDRAFT_722990 [Exidia glandulosa HHB12029]
MLALPAEILGYIVALSIEGFHKERYSQLEGLAAVSRHWRAATLGNTTLWNDVYLDRGTTEGQLATLLHRSAQSILSVDLEVTVRLEPRALRNFGRVMGQVHRIRKLVIRDIAPTAANASPWPLEVIRPLNGETLWPQLHYLHLSHAKTANEPFLALDLRISAPKLQSLALSHLQVRDPSSLPNAFPGLQSLTITGTRTFTSMLPVLTDLSCLRSLSIVMRWGSLTADIRPSFSLPLLESLDIDVGRLRPSVLSNLASNSCPRLTSLRVKFQDVAEHQGENIEISSPLLTVLHIEMPDEAPAFPRRPHIPIHFRVAPRALVDLALDGVMSVDIGAAIGPSLQKLTLASSEIDVAALCSALTQCHDLQQMTFIDLDCATTIDPNPTILTSLKHAVIRAGIQGRLDRTILRLFAYLLPPMIEDVQIYGPGTPCPSGFLRPMLDFLGLHALPMELSLDTRGQSSYFYLTEHVHNYKRLFVVKSASECLQVLLVQPTFYAHIRKCTVGIYRAAEMLSKCGGSLPILEEVVAIYHAGIARPYSVADIEVALQHLAQSASSIDCPRLRTLGIRVHDDRAPRRPLFPFSLRDALLALFRSDQEVSIDTGDTLEWRA